MTNRHLNVAKKTKNDEFYTTYADAGKMIAPFAHHFRNASVLCNCDNPDKSQTYKYLKDNFRAFGIKTLVCVGRGSYMEKVQGAGEITRIAINNGGDFRTGESLTALKRCDVVVSNPPFSRTDGHRDNMFTEFVRLALDNGKRLLSIGPLDGAKYVRLTPDVISGRLNVIKSPYTLFDTPASNKRKNVKVAIFTTFPEDPFSDEMKLGPVIDMPVDVNEGVPAYINGKGNFSVVDIPDIPAGERMIVPLGVFRKKWRRHFQIVDLIDTVRPEGTKPKMSGVLVERI